MLTYSDSVIAAADANPDGLLTRRQLERLLAEHDASIADYLPDTYHPSWRNTLFCPYQVLEYLGY